MAIEASTGWNTSAAFQGSDYDPTALSKGLQAAANYDPAQQSTTTPTAITQFLPATMQSNNAAANAASGTATSTASVAPTTTTNYGITDASNNDTYKSYAAAIPAQSAQVKFGFSGGTIEPSVVTPYAPNIPQNTTATGTLTGGATAAAATAKQQAAQQVAYSGPQVVVAQIGNGGQYYKWNQATGTYVYAGTYDFNDPNNPYAGQRLPTYTLPNGANDLAYINQQQAGNVATWLKQVDAQTATNAANAVTAAGTSTYNSVMDYLTTHNGQLDSASAAMLANTHTSGSNATYAAQQAAIAKAQTDYAAQAAHASALSNIAIKPVDTSAVDATNQAALNSYISQASTAGGGRGNVYGAASLAGQNVLNTEKAAATSYNSNLTNFSNALTTQYQADQTATGNQLYSDIQGVQQIAAQLQQEMSQLSTKQQQQVQGQLQALNQLLSQYQNSVNAYGQNSAQAVAAAKSILSAAGSVAAGLV